MDRRTEYRRATASDQSRRRPLQVAAAIQRERPELRSRWLKWWRTGLVRSFDSSGARSPGPSASSEMGSVGESSCDAAERGADGRTRTAGALSISIIRVAQETRSHRNTLNFPERHLAKINLSTAIKLGERPRPSAGRVIPTRVGPTTFYCSGESVEVKSDQSVAPGPPLQHPTSLYFTSIFSQIPGRAIGYVALAPRQPEP
jgi:hypothetical protein